MDDKIITIPRGKRPRSLGSRLLTGGTPGGRRFGTVHPVSEYRGPVPVSTRSVPRSLWSPERAVDTIVRRREFLEALLDWDNDVVDYGSRLYKKKSYWRKVLAAAGISLEKRDEWREVSWRGVATYYFTVRAILPNGQFVDATGSCTQDEGGRQRSLHDTRATAETRAKNRAISDLLAFGEVTAEEINFSGNHLVDSQPTDSQSLDNQTNGEESSVKQTGENPAAREQEQEKLRRLFGLLGEVLPGTARHIAEDTETRGLSYAEVEAGVRKAVAQEIRLLDRQGFFSLEDSRRLSVRMFALDSFERLNVEQVIGLLGEIQKSTP